MYGIISLLLTALIVVILAEVILSWIDPQRRLSVTGLVHTVTDPILNPIRRVLPSTGMFDFAPMIALIILFFVQRYI